MRSLPPELKAYFDLHRAGTADHRRALSEMLAPIAKVRRDAYQHMIELEHELEEVEASDHAHVLNGKVGSLRNQLIGLRTASDAFRNAAHELIRQMRVVDECFARDEKDVLRLLNDGMLPDEEPTA